MNTREQIPKTHEELIEMISKGYRPRLLLFWGHRISPNNSVTKSCLSQWYPAPFEIDALYYPTAEHFMMAEKARLFEDSETLDKILLAKSPAQAKKFGRMVKNYDDRKWKEQCSTSVVKGNIEKFTQNPKLGEFLINTNKRILVEASPVDRIWGIGLAAEDPRAEDPQQWRGSNLLGFALMSARAQIQNK